MKLTMMMFIDQVDYMRKKDDLFDFLIRQTDEAHLKFIFGERAERMETLSLYELLIVNVNKIRYGDTDVVWTKKYGLMEKASANLTEHLWKDEFAVNELVFSEDIKKLYMEQIS